MQCGLERGLQGVQLAFGERKRGGNLGGCEAAMAREQRAKSLDHVWGGKKAAVPGDELEEVRGQAFDFYFFEDGGDSALLLLGGEHRALHQAAQILDGVERRSEAVQILCDLLERLFFQRELKQRGGIAARDACGGVYFTCHELTPFLPDGRFSSAAASLDLQILGLELPRQQPDNGPRRPTGRPAEAVT